MHLHPPQQNATHRRSNGVAQCHKHIAKGHLQRPVLDGGRVHDVREDAHHNHDPVAEQEREYVLDQKRHFGVRVLKVHAQDEAKVLDHLPEEWHIDQRLAQVVAIAPQAPEDHQDEGYGNLK